MVLQLSPLGAQPAAAKQIHKPHNHTEGDPGDGLLSPSLPELPAIISEPESGDMDRRIGGDGRGIRNESDLSVFATSGYSAFGPVFIVPLPGGGYFYIGRPSMVMGSGMPRFGSRLAVPLERRW